MLKKFYGFVHTHFKQVVNIFALVLNFQNFFLEFFSIAYFTAQMHICQKLHFYNHFSIAFTNFAATAFYVERKIFGLIAAYFRKLHTRIQIADTVIRFYIGYRIRA